MGITTRRLLTSRSRFSGIQPASNEKGYSWEFHIELVVQELRSDGSIADWVIDPSLANEPFLVEDRGGYLLNTNGKATVVPSDAMSFCHGPSQAVEICERYPGYSREPKYDPGRLFDDTSIWRKLDIGNWRIVP